jgi:glycine hydroxymethyltransferase
VTATTYKTLLGPHGGLVLCRAEHAVALDRAVFPGTQGAPSFAQVAAKAVCLERARSPWFRAVMERTLAGATLLARTLADLGWRIVSGGTDSHMVLVDLRVKNLTGDVAETALEDVGILANRNPIPYDPAPISRTSGLRLGATGLALRGMAGDDVVEVARLIDSALIGGVGPADTRDRVADLCRRFPIHRSS